MHFLDWERPIQTTFMHSCCLLFFWTAWKEHSDKLNVAFLVQFINKCFIALWQSGIEKWLLFYTLIMDIWSKKKKKRMEISDLYPNHKESDYIEYLH